MNDKLRVGVIGLGGISAEQHLPHWASSPHAELVAFCDIDSDRLAKQARKYGVTRTYNDWEELVASPDVDVLDITTPNRWHAPMTIAGLTAGKHVLCEKPMATSTADAQAMLDASRTHHRKLMINHHFRFNRTAEDLNALAGSSLGTPYHAQCQWLRRRRVPTAPTFLDRELSGGGPMFDIGVHVVDLAMWWMGYPKPISVSGNLGTYLGRSKGLGGDWGDWEPEKFGVEDFACALFRLAGGATLAVETSWLGFYETDERWSVRVLGTEAGLHWPEGLVVTEQNKIPQSTQLTAKDRVTPYEKSIHRFAEAIIQNRPVPIPPEQSLEVVRMMEGVYRSSESGREYLLDG